MRNNRYMWRAVFLAALAAGVCFFGLTSKASGQGREDVRAQLEQTDQLLDRARDVVTQVGGIRGQQMFTTAEHLQQQAWDFFNRGQLRQAARMTETARRQLLDLLSTFRQNEENVNEVERQLERTDRTLQDVRDQVGPGATPPLTRRLEAATDMQRRAWDMFRQNQLRPALKMTLQAREMATQLASGNGMGLGRGPGGMGGEDGGIAFEPRYDRLHEAAERVGECVNAGDNAAAREMWQRAESTLENARLAHGEGDDRRADLLLRQTREFLERAMRQVQREVRGDEIGVLITSAKERLDLLAPSVQTSGEQRLQDWFDEARQHLERAQDALNTGVPQQALVQTRKAVALMDKIADDLGI